MPPDSVSLTRGDIVALGQRGDAWAFLPVAAQALRVLDRDPQFRALYAANFARLGLRTAAMEHAQALLELTAADVSAREEAQQLASAIERLADDRVPIDAQLATLRGNAAALAERGVGLEGIVAAFEASTSGWTVCRATDGNVIRRSPAGEWIGVADARGNARSFVAHHLVSAANHPEPVTIEGISPPWVLIEAINARPVTTAGFAPTIRIVQEDPAEAAAGLAIADLREIIRDERTEWFVGPGAGEVLEAHLAERAGSFTPGPYIPLTTLGTRAVSPSVPDVLDAARRRADEINRSQSARVEATYATRDAAWWCARWEQIASGTGPPMRVLLATSRFTTYVRHAIRDLADAFENAGASVLVLEEPDDHSVLSASSYSGAIAEHDPDLIVAANYPRWKLSSVVPDRVPFVCWVQDAMPHMYEPGAGERTSAMELLVGTITADMLAQNAYPAAQCIAMPVAASTRKFHTGDIPPPLQQRVSCDVAYIGNQSKTPDRTHDRLVQEASDSADAVRALEAFRPHIDRIATRSDVEFGWTALRAAIREAEQEARATLDPVVREHLVRHYGVVMLDRTLRHQTLRWAAEICDRRGWSLGIFGAGWELVEGLAPHARGPLEHGEEARAAYACAAVNLHVSANSIVHQRVLECALSGGLPIARRTADSLAGVRHHASFISRDLDRPIPHPHHAGSGCSWVSHPELMAAAAQLQRCDFPIGEACWLRAGKWDDLGPHAQQALGMRFHAGWLMGDLADTTFTDQATLEARIERAITRPAWRANVSRGIAQRVRSRLTHDSMVETIIHAMGQRLGCAASSGGAKPESPQHAGIAAA